MRHETKSDAIRAAKEDARNGITGVSHRVGHTGVTYSSEADGVYRHERNDNGGVRGIACPTRRIAKR